jgi:hypothetical protein
MILRIGLSGAACCFATRIAQLSGPPVVFPVASLFPCVPNIFLFCFVRVIRLLFVCFVIQCFFSFGCGYAALYSPWSIFYPLPPQWAAFYPVNELFAKSCDPSGRLDFLFFLR